MIEVDHLSKSCGSRRALDDVSFTAPAGLVTGSVGPNGAGKSTVMRIAAGLCAPDAGTVRVLSAPFARAERPATTMGVFLSPEWSPPAATARGVLEYACDSQGFSRTRASEALETVGLGGVATARVGSFSLGMRQRLGIAAASHHMAELALIAENVVMLNRGRVVAEGAVRDVVAGASSGVYAISPDPASFAHAVAEAGYVARPERDGFLIADAEPLEIGRLAYAAGAGLSRHRGTGRMGAHHNGARRCHVRSSRRLTRRNPSTFTEGTP